VLTTLLPSCAVKNPGSLNILKSSGPISACIGTALPFCILDVLCVLCGMNRLISVTEYFSLLPNTKLWEFSTKSAVNNYNIIMFNGMYSVDRVYS
jgi:hypothetical protein